MQKLMGDEGWGGGLVFLYWPQVSVTLTKTGWGNWTLDICFYLYFRDVLSFGFPYLCWSVKYTRFNTTI